MNTYRYGRTYRNSILVTKFRVSYVKITSTKRNTGRPLIGPHDRLYRTFKQRIVRNWRSMTAIRGNRACPTSLHQTRTSTSWVMSDPSSFLQITALFCITGIWSQSCISILFCHLPISVISVVISSLWTYHVSWTGALQHAGLFALSIAWPSSCLLPHCQTSRFLSAVTDRKFGIGPRVHTDSQ